MAGFVAPEALDACEAAGLKAIVSDPRVSSYNWENVNEAVARSNVMSLVKAVGHHPAVFGVYLRVEPGARFVSRPGNRGVFDTRAGARKMALYQPVPRLRQQRPTGRFELHGISGTVCCHLPAEDYQL